MKKTSLAYFLALTLLGLTQATSDAQRYRPPPSRPRIEPIRPVERPSERSWERPGGTSHETSRESERSTEERHTFTRAFEIPSVHEEFPHISSHSVLEPWKGEDLQKYDLPALHSINQAVIERSKEDAKPEVIAILPKGEQYLNAYGKRYSAKAEAEMKTASEKFSQLRLGKTQIIEHGGKEEFLNRIRQSEANPVIVVGHSVETGKLQKIMLPSGEGVPVAEVLRAALESGHPCILVTCHGEDLGIKDEISWTTAYDICHRAEEAYIQNKAKNPQELLLVMRQKATTWTDPGVSVIFAVVINTAGVAIVAGTGPGGAGGGDIQMVIANYDSDSKAWIYWLLAGGGLVVLIGFLVYKVREK